MNEKTKAKLHAIALLTESSFDRALIWLAGSRWTLALFVGWTLGAVAFGWWVST